MNEDTSQLIVLALDHQRAGRLADAQKIYRAILRTHPNHAEAMHFLGVVLHQNGQSDEAVKLLRRAIELLPAIETHHAHLSREFESKGDAPRATNEAQLAAQARSDLASANYNLGTILRELGDFHGAADVLRVALQLEPDLAAAHESLGLAQLHLQQLDEAWRSLNRAVELSLPGAATLLNLGKLAMTLGEIPRAIELYEKVESNDSPSAAEARPIAGSNRLMALNYQDGVSSQALFDAHVEWGRRYADLLATSTPREKSFDRGARLRAGFVSPDFASHAVATFLLPLFIALDHDRLELTCYSQVASPDSTTAQFQSRADRWRDIRRLSDEQLARQIREDRIDVLLDLAGHTANNRLLTFAQSPAPAQVSYLGWQNTTGMRAMQYRITDVNLDPPGETERFHTEKMLRLPEIFAVFSAPGIDVPVAPQPAFKTGVLTFGSFARLDKITTPMLELWTRVLHRVPRSRLIMYAEGLHSMNAQSRVREVFRAAGISVERIELFGSTSFDRYLAAHSTIDLLLDTFPFNGHTTTCHGLWMGVPTLTLAGDRYASRMGLSVMTALGLPQFIARTPDEYVECVSKLAGEIEKLSALRRTMRERMRASVLMDAPRLAQAFENALFQCARG